MMLHSPAEATKLLAYNRWANAKMLEPVSGASAEEWGRELGGSFGSLQGTLLHLYGAEWVWLERARGISPKALPGPGDVPDLQSLRDRWSALEDGLAKLSRGLTADSLASDVSYANLAGARWTYSLADVLCHLVNHSTYHRGQVATLLRQLGKTPLSTDYSRFLQGGVPAPERTPAEISRLFAYNRWAKARMLAAASRLSPADYGRAVGGSFATLRDTLVHIYGADWVWLERFGGRSPRALPKELEGGTFDELRSEWGRVEKGWTAVVDALTPERMTAPLEYVAFSGDAFRYPAGDLLVHVVNHATYHRGQVATLMRQLGAAPASTDYLMMLDEGA